MMMSAAEFNQATEGTLPGLLGFHATESDKGRVVAQIQIRHDLLAPNGYLHAATVIALADTACGLGARSVLPEGASGFTTIEIKSNFLGTAREGTIQTTAIAVHAGKTTQVWDAVVTHVETGKKMALFRCTQSVLWPN